MFEGLKLISSGEVWSILVQFIETTKKGLELLFKFCGGWTQEPSPSRLEGSLQVEELKTWSHTHTFYVLTHHCQQTLLHASDVLTPE